MSDAVYDSFEPERNDEKKNKQRQKQNFFIRTTQLVKLDCFPRFELVDCVSPIFFDVFFFSWFFDTKHFFEAETIVRRTLKQSNTNTHWIRNKLLLLFHWMSSSSPFKTSSSLLLFFALFFLFASFSINFFLPCATFCLFHFNTTHTIWQKKKNLISLRLKKKKKKFFFFSSFCHLNFGFWLIPFCWTILFCSICYVKSW